jgi:hypothetical protein
MWHDQYLLTSVERTVRDAQQMLEKTDRTDWGIFIVQSDEGPHADEYFAAFRAELLRQLAPLIVEQHARGVVLSNGRRRMHFEIGREYAKERLARIQAEERARASEHKGGPVRYQSDYANQVHQLIVSVSRHLWVTKEGLLRYQRKPLEVSLAKLARTEKRHVVHYLIRDHHSGLLYAEMAVTPQLFSAREFLLRAWSRTDQLSFSGVTDALTVPKTVADAFPDLLHWLDELGVEAIAATSGFQRQVFGTSRHGKRRYGTRWTGTLRTIWDICQRLLRCCAGTSSRSRCITGNTRNDGGAACGRYDTRRRTKRLSS